MSELKYINPDEIWRTLESKIKQRWQILLGLKIIIYSCIFLSCSAICILISRKYEERVKQLKEFKNALNMFKTKIKFTYEPIPEIFEQISKQIETNTGKIFKLASCNMEVLTAGDAWNMAVDTNILSINDEDRNILKNLSKLLGQTDLEGQINQIELTSRFLDEQIEKAEKERLKSEKMYRTLGMVIGLAIVIILM